MEKNVIKVLLIDDDEEEHFILHKLLNSIVHSNYALTCITDYQVGLIEISSGQYDVCFIDYCLGREDGLSLVRSAIHNGCNTPLILLTGQGDRKIDVTAMEAGAMDYANKGEINSQLLERIIRYAIERKKIENELKKTNKQLLYLAENDLLTGVANRNQFNKILPVVVERCIRNNQSLAIMFVDLDEFKQINDTFGHIYGDLLLQQVANLLKNNLRKIDYLFRLGGDEFIMMIEGDINKEKIKQFAVKIINMLSTPFVINNHRCQISASIGITIATSSDMRSTERLIHEADHAMYEAKKKGRNTFHFYHPE